MNLPSAIIFINADLNQQTLLTLQNQLFINEIISSDEFNDRIISDSNYVNNVHGQNLRILVIHPDFKDYTNRDAADVVMFFNQGQITIEKNKYGPPTLSLPILHLNVWTLLRGAGSSEVVILPETPAKTISDCVCWPKYGVGGIVALELRDTGITACQNPDNIYNNEAFINRK